MSEMREKTQEQNRIGFIKSMFRRYYRGVDLSVEDLPEREFAFMFFETEGMLRHLSFTADGLKRFVLDRLPAHIYYSSALYQKPDAKTMNEKNWLGADLIFDLDADHIAGSEKMSYEEMLAKVKAEFRKLVDEFLLGDFGFDEREVKIVFSGGRGYHAHISSPAVRKLGANERREIVDYISGTGLIEGEKVDEIKESLQRLFEVEKVYIPSKNPKWPGKEVFASIKLPPPDATGWRKRLGDGIIQSLLEWEKMSREEFIKLWVGKEKKKKVDGVKGVGEKTAPKVYEELFVHGKARRIIEERKISGISSETLNALLHYTVQKLAPALSGETDEPVTADIKRLIRLPKTLHGKTGFVVKEMTRQEFEDFEPLRDALPEVYTDEPVKIGLTKAVDIKLRNERFSLSVGETEIPEFAAVFLICRGFGVPLSGHA